jgi:hypothetical protein
VYKPSELRRPRDAHRGRRLATAAAVVVGALATVVLLPDVGATARVNERGASPAPSPAPATAAAQNGKAAATYQLRCWQYGRLLFDEGPVTLSPDARQAARVVAYDRNGAAVIVTDTGGTTCMARPFSTAAPHPALPR